MAMENYQQQLISQQNFVPMENKQILEQSIDDFAQNENSDQPFTVVIEQQLTPNKSDEHSEPILSQNDQENSPESVSLENNDNSEQDTPKTNEKSEE